MHSSVLQHIARERVAWHDITLPQLGDEQVLVEAEYSAISPGTESLIFQGRIPPEMPLDATLESLPGTFSYPFSYGYALVGKVAEVGSKVSHDWIGRRVFLFHPHQRHVVVPVESCLTVPDGIPSRAAVFLPNMESALNFVMDGRPLVGEKAIVFGQGVVGILTTAILANFPLNRLITIDKLAARRACSIQWGAHESVDPARVDAWHSLRKTLFKGDCEDGADLCFELSGNMEALNQAIELSGFAGRVIIGSWYGNSHRPLDLGGHFHRRRIHLISSQVSTLSPELSGRWNKTRRMALVWDWIRRVEPDRLITHVFELSDCQQAFELTSARADGVLQTIFRY